MFTELEIALGKMQDVYCAVSDSRDHEVSTYSLRGRWKIYDVPASELKYTPLGVNWSWRKYSLK